MVVWGVFFVRQMQPMLIGKTYCTCIYIFAKLKKRTNIYNSLQFPAEIHNRGSKTATTYFLLGYHFHKTQNVQEAM